MEIDCPECDEANDLDSDDLPDAVYMSVKYECKHCEHEFKIGWYATVELRQPFNS